MAIVPPGNKQVGSFTLRTTAGSGTLALKIEAAEGIGLIKDSNNVAITQAPYRVQIGEVSMRTLSKTASSLKVEGLLGLALVKYTPPTTLSTQAFMGLSIVKDSTVSGNLKPPLNVGVGEMSIRTLVRTGVQLRVEGVIGLALIRMYTVRDELISHNIF